MGSGAFAWCGILRKACRSEIHRNYRTKAPARLEIGNKGEEKPSRFFYTVARPRMNVCAREWTVCGAIPVDGRSSWPLYFEPGTAGILSANSLLAGMRRSIPDQGYR